MLTDALLFCGDLFIFGAVLVDFPRYYLMLGGTSLPQGGEGRLSGPLERPEGH